MRNNFLVNDCGTELSVSLKMVLLMLLIENQFFVTTNCIIQQLNCATEDL